MTTLPSAKTCGDILSKDNLDDDEVVRNFLIVALVTFLCPNSRVYPSTEYLQPLVDVKKAKEWDWSRFVHYWLLKQIKKYHTLMKKPSHASITMGGCLYIICVAYLDFLNIGQQQLPATLPRINVWKGDMIKERSNIDRVESHSYGKCSTIEDVTALYMKHTTGANDSTAENAKSIIVDVIKVNDNNVNHGGASDAKDVPVDLNENIPGACGGTPLSTRDNGVQGIQTNDDDTRALDTEHCNGAGSGNTVLVQSSGGDSSSVPLSIAET
ncbi:hypothetical protein C2845_PM07G16370 [Panicum miliaceum]|uniref:Aminotransferase-like plant mobile domain-containing protein n=1 Tax=Panicum miliaceum TaxID=4540 RepID=A0A3L6SNJ0_PANMI|nr:hypothetical protein C2845_PM07G16370 [Panicum miliaceum]